MFFDDILLCKQMVEKHGLLLPAVDFGGQEKPVCADYQRTIESKVQSDRYLTFDHPPFQESLGDYLILNPDKGDPTIEESVDMYREYFGTIVCVSVLEHTENPFEIFSAFYKLLQPKGLLIVSTEFSFPYHASPPGFPDNFRFSPTGLDVLARYAGLNKLESGWRLQITADLGILNTQNGKPQEIFSTYIVCRK